jgi:hypothetical protein
MEGVLRSSGPDGFERTEYSSKKTGSGRSEGAQEGAFRAKTNQNLTRLAEQLGALSDVQREALLRVIGGGKSKRG